MPLNPQLQPFGALWGWASEAAPWVCMCPQSSWGEAGVRDGRSSPLPPSEVKLRCHRNLDFCSVAVWFLKTILARAKAEVLSAERGETESAYLGGYCKTPAQPFTLLSSCSRANDRATYPCRGGGARPSGCVVALMKYSHLGIFSVGHWGPVTLHLLHGPS